MYISFETAAEHQCQQKIPLDCCKSSLIHNLVEGLQTSTSSEAIVQIPLPDRFATVITVYTDYLQQISSSSTTSVDTVSPLASSLSTKVDLTREQLRLNFELADFLDDDGYFDYTLQQLFDNWSSMSELVYDSTNISKPLQYRILLQCPRDFLPDNYVEDEVFMRSWLSGKSRTVVVNGTNLYTINEFSFDSGGRKIIMNYQTVMSPQESSQGGEFYVGILYINIYWPTDVIKQLYHQQVEVCKASASPDTNRINIDGKLFLTEFDADKIDGNIMSVTVDDRPQYDIQLAFEADAVAVKRQLVSETFAKLVSRFPLSSLHDDSDSSSWTDDSVSDNGSGSDDDDLASLSLSSDSDDDDNDNHSDDEDNHHDNVIINNEEFNFSGDDSNSDACSIYGCCDGCCINSDNSSSSSSSSCNVDYVEHDDNNLPHKIWWTIKDYKKLLPDCITEHGRWRVWYNTGQLMQVRHYDHGKKVGQWCGYYQSQQVDADGGDHDNGNYDGDGGNDGNDGDNTIITTITDNSTIVEQKGDDKSQPIKAFEINFNSRGESHGQWLTYHKNGQVSADNQYKSNLRFGDWHDYSASGKLTGECHYDDRGRKQGLCTEERAYCDSSTYINYVDNRKHGRYEERDRDGKLVIQASYLNGKLHGERREYYDNGQLNELQQYEHGRECGVYESYYKGGQISIQAEYLNGCLHGLYQTWNEHGQPINCQMYNKGILVSDTEAPNARGGGLDGALVFNDAAPNARGGGLDGALVFNDAAPNAAAQQG